MQRLLDHVGLLRPFRFERTVPVLLALLSAVVVALIAIRFAASGVLPLDSPRGAYFVYLFALIALVIVLARWPRLAITVLVLMLIELTWGFGTYALNRVGIKTVLLLPPDEVEPRRFQWHPLLQAVPIPSLSMTSLKGVRINHSSQGTRGRDPKPGELDGRSVVATVGGSTTYDIGVSEGDTWSDRLAAALGDRFFVVNHGVPGYTTVEHLIQTAFYQDKFGKAPRCAIYYVGWNDLRNAHIPNLDPAYADFHLPNQVDGLLVRRWNDTDLTFSPLLSVLMRLGSAIGDTVRYEDPRRRNQPKSGDDPALIALFERNVRSISAINRQRGVKTIWVSQLVNPDRLTGDGFYGWVPLVRDKDVWPLLQKFNQALGATARSLGDVYVDVPAASFSDSDFVDNGHFSPQGAQRFAETLAPVVRDACR
jgi:hypothetical protein